MGFGILTVGYYIAFLVGMIWQSEIWGGLVLLLGCVLMMVALASLMEYEHSFRIALFFSAFLTFSAIYRTFYLLSEQLLWDLSVFSGSVLYAVEIAEFVAFVIFQVAMLLAVRRLASDVDDPKIVGAATRNTVVLGLYAAVQLLSVASFPAAAYFALSARLLQIVYHLLIGGMLISCYMRICDERDEDMPLKKSRFAFVNRMREERARREQAAADSVTKYAEDRLKKKREKREQRRRNGGNKR